VLKRTFRRLLPRRSHPLLDAPIVYRGRDEEHAAAYARAVAGDPLPFIQERYREGVRWRQVLERLLGAPPRRILDLGAGNGAVALATGAVAVDRLINHTLRHLIPQVAADALALPFPDRSFDAILCLETIEHIPPPTLPAFAAEMARVLAPGGQILVPTPPRWRYALRRDPHFGIPFLVLLPPPAQRAVAARRGFAEGHHYVGRIFGSTSQIARLFPGWQFEVLSRSRAPRRWFWDAVVLRR
jgi:SAM-dependent methyltransferase